ncbi:NIPSNAP family protein [Maribacter sp. MAR_2009_72]|uniref:NIPSNAP family protein n=1 Tax=Maribacter sp. MAR_2009_72 TaxID=1250050 RepID=UPI00119AE15C|nr:NIPSNAP family protein [Maribacter sp. MAR_2009_72]TVZ17011.1 NIPSNAP protein [Maribacter sp. MAR_2009_72]
MNTWKSFLLLTTIIMMACSNQGYAQEREFYELKTYTIKNEDQEQRMDHYLEKAYLPALKRMGIPHIGVFKMHNDKFIPSNKIYILIPYKSLAEFESTEKLLALDKAHLTQGADYINASFDNPPYERINSVLMRAFPDMPKMRPTTVEGPRKDRVYELRSYESPTEALYKNKVHMFNEGGEVELFESLGFNAVFYAEVISGDRMPNLMYMTTFSDMNKRNDLWKNFSDSPKWKEISSMKKYQNNMNKLDKDLLYPTPYSDY